MSKFSDIKEALTYDDVLLKPSYSSILPKDTSLISRFSRNVPLNIPLISAAMDTVTKAETAICMAQQGAIGVIHRNSTANDQVAEVLRVKKYESGTILNPITVHPDDSLEIVYKLTKDNNITGVPVVDNNYKLVGIITHRDMRWETDLAKKVRDIMTPYDRLIIGHEGIDRDEACKLLHKHRVEKLPIVDKNNCLKGLITIKDILKTIVFPDSNRDKYGRLMVAAAIGTGDDEFEKACHLVEVQVDALVIDTAHGHSKGVIEMLTSLKQKFPSGVDIIVGNVATRSACEDLIKNGADGIKVGMGPGSICTTRVISGMGVPQMSAIMDAQAPCDEAGIPFIADGGIKYSGDIVKALAAGADSVMLGSMLAGTDEAPGELIRYQGRAYKIYRGMGSLGAMIKGSSKDRYSQEDTKEIGKLIPEGIEGQVSYRGPLSATIFQLVGGIRAGMGYLGAENLLDLRKKAEFIRITPASLRENHPHDIRITKEAPNYSIYN